MFFQPISTLTRPNYHLIPTLKRLGSRLVIAGWSSRRYASSQTEKKTDDSPIKYSTSRASQWRARSSIEGPPSDRLWYEPHVILVSLAVFLIYFGYLREENDIDQELGRSLYSRIEGLEEFQLQQSLEFNLQHNKDTAAIKKRLQELEVEKLESSNANIKN